MYKKNRVTAVILAAGNGSRMGTRENKVYTRIGTHLGGCPMIQYALTTFDRHPYVDELVLTARSEEVEKMEGILKAISLSKPCRIVIGGKTRQASVRNAVAVVKTPLVIVHDGARPLIQSRYISDCLEALDHYHGAILALPVKEPICRISARRKPPQVLQEPVYAVQTPQCFRTNILRACHQKHETSPAITDDSCLLELEGYSVGVVEGDPCNIKVTTPLDLPVAEAYRAILEAQQKPASAG